MSFRFSVLPTPASVMQLIMHSLCTTLCIEIYADKSQNSNDGLVFKNERTNWAFTTWTECHFVIQLRRKKQQKPRNETQRFVQGETLRAVRDWFSQNKNWLVWLVPRIDHELLGKTVLGDLPIRIWNPFFVWHSDCVNDVLSWGAPAICAGSHKNQITTRSHLR